jgi:Holliday junction resolvasome RuvABC endonuclease subunit
MTVLGIDLGIRKVAICVITNGINGYTCYGVPRLQLTKHDRAIELYKLSTYVQTVLLNYDPDGVFIEKPIIGNNRKYSMAISETCGAVQVGIAKKDGSRQKVVLVDNNTWKKDLIGDGHASKDDVRNYINVTHPAYAPFCGDDQDAYDACCIALYGVTITDRAKHLSL